MTYDELEKFLMKTIAPSLEQAWSDRDASEQKLAEKELELEEERCRGACPPLVDKT